MKKKVIDEIHKTIAYFDLHDNWRVRNPNLLRYTWRQKLEHIQCRLDYFLISNSLQDFVTKSEITPGVKTDHSAIKIMFKQMQEHQHGKGYWKFNESLTIDQTYTNAVKINIQEWKQEVRHLDPRHQWEFVKYKIRNFTITYSKKKSGETRQREKELKNKITDLESNLGRDNYEEYVRSKKELEQILVDRVKGNIIRSKVQWYDEGERGTRYFHNLEKQNYSKKCIKKLQNDNGQIITEPDKILYNFIRNYIQQRMLT